MLSENELQKINEYSINNIPLLEEAQKCGCFFCGRIFDSNEIAESVEDEGDDTAICPFCGIDSVIGESSGYKITAELLKQMHDYWFR